MNKFKTDYTCNLKLWFTYFFTITFQSFTQTNLDIKDFISFQTSMSKVNSLLNMSICIFQGSDPSTYEMIQKIQTLQKRLIAKTEEVVEKELLIQEKEKLYVELKHILARQPGPEVAEQLQIYQQTLKEKTKQMKVSLVVKCFSLKPYLFSSVAKTYFI